MQLKATESFPILEKCAYLLLARCVGGWSVQTVPSVHGLVDIFTIKPQACLPDHKNGRLQGKVHEFWKAASVVESESKFCSLKLSLQQ